MSPAYWLCVVAALAGILLGLAAIARKRRSVASLWFFAGMTLLAAESMFAGISLSKGEPSGGSCFWLRAAFVAKSAIPGCWLCFSMSFSRGNHREFLRRWRFFLVAAFVVPMALAFVFHNTLLEVVKASDTADYIKIGTPAKILTGICLAAAIIVLANVEKTFRAAMGTARWRVKFLVIGVGLLFGTKVFTLSQTLLFPVYNPVLITVEAGALLGACGLMAVGYARRGFSDLEIYPSRAVLQKSVSIVVAGFYLLIVGVLAEYVGSLGGAGDFPFHAFIIMLGVVGFAVLLLSDRVRTSLQRFISRNFRRPQYDFRKVWASVSKQLSGVVGVEKLCAAASRLLADTFDVLSTSIFLFDRNRGQFILVSSTTNIAGESVEPELGSQVSVELSDALRDLDAPFVLENIDSGWAARIRIATAIQFSNGGDRYCARLAAGEQIIGLLVVSDRVGGVELTQEELDLLQCMADELAARLQGDSLTEELLQAREMEAFQAMSTFFMHDLKNAASSLNLTLRNLPNHFDDPDFREDALRGLGKTADRIKKLTDRLGELRSNLEIETELTNFNLVVEAALEQAGGGDAGGGRIEHALAELPPVSIDRERVTSVVTNLIVNAMEAIEPDGKIKIETACDKNSVILMVSDDGCGMSADFVDRSLFRPFRSTKKQGFGIGMFQSRLIVEAHRGAIRVESELEEGSTFRIEIPVA